jgi:hypothetical protein
MTINIRVYNLEPFYLYDVFFALPSKQVISIPVVKWREEKGRGFFIVQQ